MAKELKAMTVRIDADVYERATEVFAALGTDLTSAIRVSQVTPNSSRSSTPMIT